MCVFISACTENESAIVPSDEGLVSVTEISYEIAILSAEEVKALKKEEGIHVLEGTSDQEKTKLPCRWSDDLDGTVYGTVDCQNGRCSAARITHRDRGTTEQVIACVAPDGGITVGASRGERP